MNTENLKHFSIIFYFFLLLTFIYRITSEAHLQGAKAKTTNTKQTQTESESESETLTETAKFPIENKNTINDPPYLMQNGRKQYLQRNGYSPPTAYKCGKDIFKYMRLPSIYQLKTKIHTAHNRQASNSNTVANYKNIITLI